ncbi:hypothetical protein HKX48_002005 [Thoreauomyces humboldtii]|nr:hypothetical protein HKX48_002005 [Thoreauomyces humboldtii]
MAEHDPNLAIVFRTLSIHTSEAAKPKKTKGVPPAIEFDFHRLTVDEICQRFSTSSDRGLDQTAAATRLARNGKNQITPPKDSKLLKIAGYVFGGFCPLLWVAALMCFIAWKPLGSPPDPLNLYLAIVILIVILIQALFTAYQDWTTSKVMSSINSLLPSESMVTRDAIKQKVETKTLVLGDLVHLTLGGQVPADLRLISVTADVRFDRAILTGEAEPVGGTVAMTDANYLESNNIALTGTLVTNGAATGIVIAVGDNTVMGAIAKLSTTHRNDPPLLQLEITRFVRIVAAMAVFTGVIVLVVWGAWLKRVYPDFLSSASIVVNVIGVMVAFVPEGMPVAVTMTLTAVARQMARHKILCKVLTTVETLGSINVLASDKTGTLTENKMFVSRAGFGVGPDQQDLTPARCREMLMTPGQPDLSAVIQQLRTAAALCNGASFDTLSLDLPLYQRKVNGDATDSALLRFAEDLPSGAAKDAFEKVHEVPFNSKNKWMMSLYRVRDTASKALFGCEAGNLLMFTKGAPDVILPLCTTYLDGKGMQQSLSADAIAGISKLQERWSNEGQRVLILTFRLFTDANVLPLLCQDYSNISERVLAANTGLCIIGLLGIVDPPRPEIPDVIARCRKAGIRVFMVTGDFRLTAAAIAKQVGIFSPNARIDDISAILDPGTTPTRRDDKDPSTDYNNKCTSLILSGPDLASGELTEAHSDKIAAYSEVVFARTTPEQKLRIVTEFRNRDNVVGVTGDGVNDAPALKAAHIGVAMGAGSDVAMAAGDMILLDSNFSSMLIAIEYGRLVFENLKKVIIYLLPAGSWSELWPVLFNVFLGVPLPLSTFLMIVICLFTDLFPSLALINELPEADLMSRKPRNPRKDRLVDFKLLLHAYGFIGNMETICALGMYLLYMKRYGGLAASDLFLVFDQWGDGYKGKTGDELNELLCTAQCVYFISLVVLQWGNLLGCRGRHNSLVQSNPITKNPYLFGAMLCSLVIAIVVLYLPFFNNVFNTRPMPFVHWVIPVALALGILLMDECRKLLVRVYPRSFLARVAW